jgi:transposase InsO family protein
VRPHVRPAIETPSGVELETRSSCSRASGLRDVAFANAPLIGGQHRSQLELAVVEYVAWFNNERLHEALGDRPPREVEDLYAVKARPTTPIR